MGVKFSRESKAMPLPLSTAGFAERIVEHLRLHSPVRLSSSKHPRHCASPTFVTPTIDVCNPDHNAVTPVHTIFQEGCFISSGWMFIFQPTGRHLAVLPHC